MPKISIIVPVYNVEKYLRHCIDSILNQTFSDFEMIIVDDGSTDRCSEIIDEYARIDRRIIPIHKENAGLGAARNTGIRSASGEYICFIDSDDFVHPRMCELLLKEIEMENADIAICKMKGLDIDETPELNKKLSTEIMIWDNIETMNQLFNLPPTINLSSCNKLFKYNDSIMFKEGIPMLEDLLYVVHRIIDCRKVVYYPETLYYFVKRTGSITRSDPEVFIEGLKIREEACEIVLEKMPQVYGKALNHLLDACIITKKKNTSHNCKKKVNRIMRKNAIKYLFIKDARIRRKVFYLVSSII